MNDNSDLDYLRTLTILYVEDDSCIRLQLAQFLNRRCANLYLATNGKEGVVVFQECLPNIVITDISMPEMDGLYMSEAIRTLNPNIPIIITTAFEEPRYFHRAIDLGVDKYVTKPVNLDMLEMALLKCAREIRAEAALRESAKRHAEFLEIQRIAAVVFESQEGMFVTDAQANILRVNRAFSEITGYSAEDVIGKNPRLFKSNRHDCTFYAQMWESVIQLGFWRGEIWNMRKNGEIYPEFLTITQVKNSHHVTNYVATLTDITLKKRAEDEIAHLAFYDALTDLPNRRLLQDRLAIALTASKRFNTKGALLFIDLDNFKKLNDTLGHDIGDLLLKEVAKRLKSCVRESDTVARLGGDEFVIMLEKLNHDEHNAIEEAKIIANKILTVMGQNYQLADYDYHNTPSIGVTLFHGHESSMIELLKQADIAMYESKTAGRNTVRFYKSTNENL
jgi:diguanylate cyclase (GGDEF)-like protein/PAS domain S-box-containing protein